MGFPAQTGDVGGADHDLDGTQPTLRRCRRWCRVNQRDLRALPMAFSAAAIALTATNDDDLDGCSLPLGLSAAPIQRASCRAGRRLSVGGASEALPRSPVRPRRSERIR